MEQTVRISLREAYEGTSRFIMRDGQLKKLVIPSGVTMGTKIRFPHQGSDDVTLVIEIAPDPVFTREGHDLRVELTVDAKTAQHGEIVEIPTMTQPVKLKLPPNVRSGQIFRLRGKGMPVVAQAGVFGDLLVRIVIKA